MAADGPRPHPAPGLDAVLVPLGLAPERVQSFDPLARRFDAARPLLVLPSAYAEARPLLDERYPSDHPARVVTGDGGRDVTVGVLPGDARAWLIAPLAPEQDHRALAGLRSIVERLYAPDGCPWDREQTHHSLRPYLLEESYEVAEAIDSGDLRSLREELGDLLVQILMHCAMAQEAAEFTLEEVVGEASHKMLRRHPHVFGDESADDAAALVERWDQIKAAERSARGEGGPGAALDAVPRAAPALLRAAALQGRAERAGAPRPDGPAAGRVREALREAESAGPRDAEARLGDLLWAVVALARERDVDAESALRAHAAAFVDQVSGPSAGDRATPSAEGAGAGATLAPQVGTGTPQGRPG